MSYLRHEIKSIRKLASYNILVFSLDRKWSRFLHKMIKRLRSFLYNVQFEEGSRHQIKKQESIYLNLSQLHFCIHLQTQFLSYIQWYQKWHFYFFLPQYLSFVFSRPTKLKTFNEENIWKGYFWFSRIQYYWLCHF